MQLLLAKPLDLLTLLLALPMARLLVKALDPKQVARLLLLVRRLPLTHGTLLAMKTMSCSERWP